MKTSRFVREIDQAIKEGRLHESFGASDIRRAIPPPCFAERTYSRFLPKHEKNKARHNKVKAYFERVGAKGSGLYRRCCN